MKNRDNNKLLFYIGIPVIFLLIILRFGIAYIRSDGFNGLSLILPIQLLCVIIFAFCSSVFFAAWVYQDCKKRGDDAVLWSIVVFFGDTLYWIAGLLSAPLRNKNDMSGLRPSYFSKG